MKVKATAVTVELSFEKDFLTFLDQNNALERFCTRFRIDREFKSLDSLISNVHPQNWILSAFPWGSNDDIKFWKNLSDKWGKTIYQPEVHATFKVLDKDNSQKIWDNYILVYGTSFQGKYYEVADNSWNRKATDDLQEVWESNGKGWKDLVGGRYLILSESPVEIPIKPLFSNEKPIIRRFIKVWIPGYECVQWVLYQGCSYVKEF